MDAKSQSALAGAVGALIARKRAEAGITQEQVAERMGIGNEAVSRMERGAVMPTVARLFEFADLFGCRVDELLIPASAREADQAASIARIIGGLSGPDREIVASVVTVLAEQLRSKGAAKRTRRS